MSEKERVAAFVVKAKKAAAVYATITAKVLETAGLTHHEGTVSFGNHGTEFFVEVEEGIGPNRRPALLRLCAAAGVTANEFKGGAHRYRDGIMISVFIPNLTLKDVAARIA